MHISFRRIDGVKLTVCGLAGLLVAAWCVGATAADCLLPATFADGALYVQTLHVDPSGNDSTGDGSAGNPFATIQRATGSASPGTKIVVHEGTYANSNYIANLQGTASQPIMITGAEDEGPAVIDRGLVGNECMHLVDAKYVIVANLTCRRALANGINIDDGASYATPSEHIVLDNVTVEYTGVGDNNDGIKLSGVDYIRIINCRILNTNAGSGIDMVGCHYSEIVFNEFRDGGSNGTQTKGGTEDVLIYGNLFENAGARAIQMGGSTGAQYFRPIDATFEGHNIRAMGNVVIGSEAAVAYVSATDCLAANNTIYKPTNWIIRILNENTTKDWPANGRFFNNIVVFNHAQIGSTFVNIGSSTLPNTFSFSNNLWYALDNPSFSGPSLPTTEIDPVIQEDPLLLDPNVEDFHIDAASPARGAGVDMSEVSGDRDEVCYLSPPAIGAYEYLTSPALVSSEPPADGTLPKTQNNVVLLTFDGNITLPGGDALGIVPIAGGADVGGSFTYSVEPDGVTLKAVEQGTVLSNQTWYRITPNVGFDVQAFTLDVCTLIGDTNNSGRVTTADYSPIKIDMTQHTDSRSDLNGSGRITTADYSVVKAHMGDRTPTKP